ncbi:hypothetical protein [Mucilaginibacter sp. KACC 22063]|uniref:hypothetical protein n=1 Tax=Mucilaginibacter sp. KACC 22063 TaxID=3025666 RepID=UPI002364FFC3|nr:hypothetical protein [Mucilaginibacter sp. KACC 22063]WDF54576.1 hypothetical protein PQ461_16715 [Mucilaginibacter sp. KACC 22063]
MRFVQVSKQSRDFNRTASDASVTFTLPEGFKETVPVNSEELTYDYAIALPDHSVEIWFAVKPYKSITRIYTNPDSAYISLGKEQVSAFSADNAYFVRNLTDRILNQYNADVGKSYLLNLNDSPATKHYKYALIITLQKNKAGALMAVCLTNDKGPDFFKEIDKARNCIKFK